MSDPGPVKSEALAWAQRLLVQRLESSGIHAGNPSIYFQCEAEEPQPFPGGFQVRVRTWKHWSDAIVELDGESGQVMRWTIDRYGDPRNEAALSEAEALAIAQKAIEIPPEAELESFHHYDFAPGRKVAQLAWHHLHQGLRVDGDYLWVLIHPRTRRVIEWARKWREVRLPAG